MALFMNRFLQKDVMKRRLTRGEVGGLTAVNHTSKPISPPKTPPVLSPDKGRGQEGFHSLLPQGADRG
jgi:hypothetical protein